MEFSEVIKERKSTRLFGSKKVEKKLLDKILEAGRIAPTAKNKQAFKILVVESKEGLKKIDKASPCRYGAKTVLVVLADLENCYRRDRSDVDPSIVATHMMLEATNLGVDNIWIGMIKDDVLKSEFELGDNYDVTCLIPLGYKAALCPPSPWHNKRKEIDELVEYR